MTCVRAALREVAGSDVYTSSAGGSGSELSQEQRHRRRSSEVCLVFALVAFLCCSHLRVVVQFLATLSDVRKLLLLAAE